MRKYAIAAAFSLALATPALAAQYYVALDSSTRQCQGSVRTRSSRGAEARRHLNEDGRQRRL